MPKHNPVISGGYRAVAQPGRQYLLKPELYTKDLGKVHRGALVKLHREITVFLRKYGLYTRGQTVIDQPAYQNKLKQQFGKKFSSMSKAMAADCHGAVLLTDNETSDLLAILTGKGAGPGLRKLIQKNYGSDPAKKTKTRILLQLLRDKFYALLRHKGFKVGKLAKYQFVPKDPYHYKAGVYRVLPLWLVSAKASGVRIRTPRRRRRRRVAPLARRKA
jgi:hypothetical protein